MFFLVLKMSLTSFVEIEKRLEKGDFIDVCVDPSQQALAEIGNTIMTFTDRNGNIYHTEVLYNNDINTIAPPLGKQVYSEPSQIINRMLQRARKLENQPLKYYRLINKNQEDQDEYYEPVNFDLIVFSGHSQEEALLKIRQYILDHSRTPIDIIKNNIQGSIENEDFTIDNIIDAMIYNFVENDDLTLTEITLI